MVNYKKRHKKAVI